MRLEKLRQADLNLLVTFAAIAEEKSITAAASRLFLSQPAVSRALQRARAMFQDDLLVRSPHGFELTMRGRKILEELEGLLPRMENLVAPAVFADHHALVHRHALGGLPVGAQGAHGLRHLVRLTDQQRAMAQTSIQDFTRNIQRKKEKEMAELAERL